MQGNLVLLGMFVAAITVAQPAVAGDQKLGEKVFRKCKSCHLVGEGAKHKIGPQLNGLFGRAAGSIDGYKFSKAMLAKSGDGLVWTDETLAAFLTAPKKYVPGTKMAFPGLKKPADIENLNAYLRNFPEIGSN
ncbi:cytochrome c family protein [Pelagibius sp. Alg239-R121]|uniref:c-type cytochrome n=1 Tax=Pelagibius sp. Alg239-R121 TaxID=2993448 RepID=UPI0024A75469|nr:cytochrome c family protein [Pelagibius sp. Alg239-R121]